MRAPAPGGIARPRLTARVLAPPAGIRLVIGPAGSGKTTALAHAAQAFDGRCAWVSLDGTDRHPAAFARSISAAVGLNPGSDVLAVVAALDDGDPTLVVVDDVHEVAGSPAGELVDLLCRYRPPQVTLALGSRELRDLHHWRWGLDPAAAVVDVDDLRFRLWEVDELFRHLRAPLAPADVHALARRTDGWAVALRLFHIVLRDRPSDAAGLLARSPRFTHRSIRGYLRDEVLSRVSEDHRTFLAGTAVLDRLEPARCDELLGRGGSAAVLEELAVAGLLVPDGDGSSYRLHDLLRDHVLGELALELGDEAVAERHRRAADVLERDGALENAARSAARGGDWDRLRRLLRLPGMEATTPLHGMPRIPLDVRLQDPWVLRAEAVRQLGEADLEGSRRSLRASVERLAETGGDPGTDALLRAVTAWLEPSPGPTRSWIGALRSSLGGGDVRTWPSDQGGRFSRGLTELVRGHLAEATTWLGEAGRGPHRTLAAMAAVAEALAARLTGAAEATGERAVALARASEAPAVVVAAEVVASGTPLADDVGAGDDVVSAFQGFCLALLSLSGDAAAPADLAHVEDVLGRQRLVVPLAVVRAAGLVRRASGGGDVDPRVLRDPALRGAGPLAQALTSLAVGVARADGALIAASQRSAAACGFRPWFDAVLAGAASAGVDVGGVPPPAPGTAAGSDAVAPGTASGVGDVERSVAVDVLGTFQLRRHGTPLDLAVLRPRHLELLQVLAVNANRWIHRETLWELLWSDRPPEAASHNLHVAVSAVRRLVDPDASRGQSAIVRRSGDRYRFEVAVDACDVCRFEQHLARADDARHGGDLHGAAGQLDRAVREWRGEPVPAAGPVDWAVARRDELRRRFAAVAIDVLAGLEPTGRSSALAARAVAIEASDDLLWHHALDHARRAGATARLRELEAAYGPR